MNELTKIFDYEGNNITFHLGNGDVMVNVTEFAKSFPDKNLTQIVNSLEIKEYVEEFSKLQNYSLADNQLIRVIRGGNNPGTWTHQRIALRIAQKLSTRFAIWVDDRIEELLKLGFTATPQTIEDMIANPDIIIQMATQLKELRASNMQKDAALVSANEVLEKVRPKVQYYEEVLSSNTQITTNSIAMELGVSAIKLNQMLRGKRIIYKQGDKWLLTSQYRGRGYEDTFTYRYFNSKGEACTKTEIRWTEKGREFIHGLFAN